MKKIIFTFTLFFFLAGSALASWYSCAQIWGKDETIPSEINISRARQENLLIAGNSLILNDQDALVELTTAVTQAQAAGLKIIGQLAVRGSRTQAPHEPPLGDLFRERAKKIVQTGVDGLAIIHDDNLGGKPITATSEACFRTYLQSKYSTAELAALGIPDIATFAYSAFLSSHGISESQLYDDSDKSSIPLFEDYLKMQDQKFSEYLNELMAIARTYGNEDIIFINCRESDELARNIKFSSFEVYSVYSEFDPLTNIFTLKENTQAYLYKTARAMHPDSSAVSQPVDLSLGGIVSKASDPEKYVYSLIAEALANKSLYYDVYDYGLWNGEWIGWNISPEINLKVKNFLQDYQAAFDFDNLQSYARIAVLYSSASQLKADRIRPLSAELSFTGICKALSKAGFQYDVIFNGDGEFRPETISASLLAPYEIVIAPEPIVLTEREKSALLSYANGGGNLIVYAEKDSAFSVSPGETNYGSGKIYYDTAPLPRYYVGTASETYLATIESQVNNYLSGKIVRGIPQTYINRQIWKTADPERVYLQLVNHDIENAVTDLLVTMEVPANFGPDKLFLVSPDLAEQELTYTQSGQTISFTVPELEVWDLLILTSTQEAHESAQKPSIINSLAYAPNPASTSTTFYYNLTEAATLTINIYSINGELIKIITDTYDMPNFNKTTSWKLKDVSGSSVKNGVYIYSLEVRGQSGKTSRRRGKLIVLR